MKCHKRSARVQPIDDNRGFTLLETLIAVLIFSFGILAVITLSVNAMNWFTQSRVATTEVNRTTLNIEALKQTGYLDNDAFRGIWTTPAGDDGATVGYNDFTDAVVLETRLITMQNNGVRGFGAGGNYEIYYVKPFIR